MVQVTILTALLGTLITIARLMGVRDPTTPAHALWSRIQEIVVIDNPNL